MLNVAVMCLVVDNYIIFFYFLLKETRFAIAYVQTMVFSN